jgi:hypothetical protein
MARGTCWAGYEQKGMKKKNGRMVPNCVKTLKQGGLLSKHNFAGAGGGLGRLHKSMSIKKLRMF